MAPETSPTKEEVAEVSSTPPEGAIVLEDGAELPQGTIPTDEFGGELAVELAPEGGGEFVDDGENKETTQRLLLEKQRAEERLGAKVMAPEGAIVIPEGAELPDNIIPNEDFILEDVGAGNPTPPSNLIQAISNSDRFVANVLLRGDPDKQKLYFEAQGWDVTERESDGELILTKGSKQGGIEAELVWSDLTSADGMRKVGSEVMQDFSDVLDDVVSAGLFTAAEIANFAVLGPYGILTAPLVGAASEAQTEVIMQAMAAKAGVGKVNPEALKMAMAVGGTTGLVTGPGAAAVKAGVKALPPAAKKKMVDGALSAITKLQGVPNLIGNAFDANNNLLTRGFARSSGDIVKRAKPLLEGLGKLGFYDDIQPGKEPIQAIYSKTLKLLGGKDFRLSDNTSKPIVGTLGPKLSSLRKMLGAKHDGWSTSEVVDAYSKSLGKSMGKSAAERSTFKSLWNSEMGNILTEGHRLGGRWGLDDIAKFNTSFSGLAGNFEKKGSELPINALFYRTLSGTGRKMHGDVVGKLALDPDPLISNAAKQLRNDSSLYNTLSDAREMIEAAAGGKIFGAAGPGAKVVGAVDPQQGRAFARFTEPLSAIFSASPEARVGRALAIGTMKGKWEAPLGRILAKKPITTAMPGTLMSTAAAPELIVRGVGKIMKTPAARSNFGQSVFQQSQTALIIEGIESALGTERAKEIVEGFSLDGFELGADEAQLIEQLHGQAESMALAWKARAEETLATAQESEVGRFISEFAQRFPDAIEDSGAHPNSAKVGGRDVIYEQDIPAHKESLRRNTSLTRGQRARMISAVNKDGTIIATPKATVPRAYSLKAPKADKKLEEK